MFTRNCRKSGFGKNNIKNPYTNPYKNPSLLSPNGGCYVKISKCSMLEIWALLGPFICWALLGPFICWAAGGRPVGGRAGGNQTYWLLITETFLGIRPIGC